jgi:hypothetical protein
MKLRTFSLLLILSLLIIGNGCKKWKNNREPLSSEDHTLAEASFNNVISYLILAASPFGELLADTCFIINTGGNSFPKTITVDFAEGCQSLLGAEILGRISVELTDSLHHENAVMTATPQNLYINSYKVDGVVTLTNTGINSSGNQTYQMKVASGIITAESGKIGEDFSITWECDYQHELIYKVNESILLDDLYRITGTATGVNEEGRSYSAEIIEPLQKYVDCRWPGSGKTTISPDDLDARDLNYGACEPSNCCDNVAEEDVKWSDKTVRMR